MKYKLTILVLCLLLSSCNKKNDEVKQVPFDSSHAAADSLRNVVKNMDKNQDKTSRGTLQQMIALDRGGAIPPHMLPIKDVVLLGKTDSTATYSLTSGSNGAKLKITMKHIITGTDTNWILSKMEDIK